MQLKTPALIAELDEKAFLNLEIKVPNLERQWKVVYTLKSYRYELLEQERFLRKQIENLEKQKRDLLDEIMKKLRS